MQYKKIKSYEDACKALGIDANALPVVTALPEKHQLAIIAHYKLVIIAQALNEGWQPDWENSSQYKYWPWFSVKASAKNKAGSGLSCNVYGHWDSLTNLCSRLCFSSSELAEYAGKKFVKLYEDCFLIR